MLAINSSETQINGVSGWGDNGCSWNRCLLNRFGLNRVYPCKCFSTFIGGQDSAYFALFSVSGLNIRSQTLNTAVSSDCHDAFTGSPS